MSGYICNIPDHLKSKSARIRDFLSKIDSEYTTTEISDKFGCSPSLVSQIKTQMKGKM